MLQFLREWLFILAILFGIVLTLLAMVNLSMFVFNAAFMPILTRKDVGHRMAMVVTFLGFGFSLLVSFCVLSIVLELLTGHLLISRRH